MINRTGYEERSRIIYLDIQSGYYPLLEVENHFRAVFPHGPWVDTRPEEKKGGSLKGQGTLRMISRLQIKARGFEIPRVKLPMGM